MRPATSVALPAVNGTTILIGCLAGQSWANAATGGNDSSEARTVIDRRIISLSLSRAGPSSGRRALGLGAGHGFVESRHQLHEIAWPVAIVELVDEDLV